jgi:DNA-binding IclR family transcriptional regulator
MVKSAERVMLILSLVGESKHGLKHQEIASSLSIPKGSLSLLLSDLVEGDFLTTNPKDKRFRVGPQILALAGRYLADMNIVEISQPIIRKLINQTGESCGIGVRNANHVIVIWRENSDEPLKWDIKIGDQYLLHSSAFGKAILAFAASDDVQNYINTTGLQAVTKNTITSTEVFLKELALIREGGLAYSKEENFLGMISIGVPVFDHTGRVVASLSVPIPVVRFNEEKERLVGDALKKTANLLSKELGYLG